MATLPDDCRSKGAAPAAAGLAGAAAGLAAAGLAAAGLAAAAAGLEGGALRADRWVGVGGTDVITCMHVASLCACSSRWHACGHQQRLLQDNA